MKQELVFQVLRKTVSIEEIGFYHHRFLQIHGTRIFYGICDGNRSLIKSETLKGLQDKVQVYG